MYAQGHLLYVTETTLLARPFDTGRLEFAGAQFPVAENVQTGSGGNSAFSVSSAGDLVYQTGLYSERTDLVWLNRAGQQLGVVGESGTYGDVALSPDGLRAMVSMLDTRAGRDLWSIDLGRRVTSRFTFDPANDIAPVWSPDGRQIAFASSRKGSAGLFLKDAAGAGAEEALLADAMPNYPLSWSADGRFLLFVKVGGSVRGDLWVLPLSGDRKPFAFLTTPFREIRGRFSPNGRWIAYQSDESGREEIYVSAFPGPGGKRQLSASGGIDPRWTWEGKEIVYSAEGGAALIRVAVNGDGAGFEVGETQQIAQLSMPFWVRSTFDVTADGQRILVSRVVQANPTTTTPPITLVVNWLAGARQR
jgi:eukaryotic-like serine/threonine-protein kinase